jgi:hypothetical protein
MLADDWKLLCLWHRISSALKEAFSHENLLSDLGQFICEANLCHLWPFLMNRCVLFRMIIDFSDNFSNDPAIANSESGSKSHSKIQWILSWKQLAQWKSFSESRIKMWESTIIREVRFLRTASSETTNNFTDNHLFEFILTELLWSMIRFKKSLYSALNADPLIRAFSIILRFCEWLWGFKNFTIHENFLWNPWPWSRSVP